MHCAALLTEPVLEVSDEVLDGSCTWFMHPALSAQCMRVHVGGTAGAWKTTDGFHSTFTEVLHCTCVERQQPPLMCGS